MTRYYLIPALVFALFLGGCSKDSKSPDNPAQGSGKKGADFSTNMQYGSWNADVLALKPFWYYTWGKELHDGSPQNCEFVPMFWGAADVTANNIAAVKKLKDDGKIKYVLGFNEPNRGDQSNVSVSQALKLWPQLESIGLPLGSPAADWPTNKWIYDFLDSCKVQGRRVDFICVHMYANVDENVYLNTLKEVYNRYKLPIWITEFAPADWNATKPENNPYTPAQVLAFMQNILPKLEALDYVKRYSWFSGDPKSPQMWSSALIDANGNLTELGKWYANYQPNTAIAK
ncbi:MAG: glycosyl hydrolase [Niastella sp.]|uniref:glycosyl hydrolase n=1 Tax=Niastella sp. TaxID=1869183 RepID=UPI00389A32D9